MKAHTGKTYTFSTFQELVDRVPGDRIRDCLSELGKVLAMAKLSCELVEGVARNMADSDGVALPAKTERVMVVPDSFDWVDDGKEELTADIATNQQKLFSVSLKKTTLQKSRRKG